MHVGMIQSFLPSLAPHGGVGLQAHQLANELCRRGHRVTMLSHDPAPQDATYAHTLLPTPRLLSGPKLLRAAEGHYFPMRVALQDLTGFDVVHAHGDNPYLFGPRRPPLVRTFHGSAVDEARFAIFGPRRVGLKEVYWAAQQLSYYPLEWLGGFNADVTVGISQVTRARLPFVEFIVGEAVQVERFARTPASTPRSPDPVILFVGSLGGRKRGTLLVEAFNTQVLPRHPTAQLWMICERSGVDGAVHYLGRRPNPELAPLFHAAWAFCLPSSYEGFGIPYIEALSAGLPVVASPNAGALEVLGQGPDACGLVVPDGELGATLCRVLEDHALQQRLAARGPPRAETFSLRAVADHYERLYELARQRRRWRRRDAAPDAPQPRSHP